jgi:hypothetical protein
MGPVGQGGGGPGRCRTAPRSPSAAAIRCRCAGPPMAPAPLVPPLDPMLLSLS